LPTDISSFSGEVVDTDDLEEVFGLMANGSGSTWTDDHRKIWVRPSHGTERRFTFTNADVPARTGHQVTILLGGEKPLALVNFSTRQCANLVTRRQFELFGAVEAFAFAALLIGAGLAGTAGLVALTVGAAVYDAAKWLVREVRYRRARGSVEGGIRRTIANPPGDPHGDSLPRAHRIGGVERKPIRVTTDWKVRREAEMAKHLENGTYLLDETERQTYTVAARMLDRVDHRELDLSQPLADFDYLLLMCAHLVIKGEAGVDETLARIVNECLEERRRH